MLLVIIDIILRKKRLNFLHKQTVRKSFEDKSLLRAGILLRCFCHIQQVNVLVITLALTPAPAPAPAPALTLTPTLSITTKLLNY